MNEEVLSTYINKRRNFRNVCYIAVQNLFNFRKNIRATAYRNIILSVVLYGCANFLSHKEDNVRVCGCKLLRKIFGSKWNLQGRKKHNERLYGLCSSPYGQMAGSSALWFVFLTIWTDGRLFRRR
jgi:hypothetical protein